MASVTACMRKQVRRVAVRGTLTLGESKTISLSERDILSFTLSEGVQDGVLLGACPAATLQLHLSDAGGAFLPLGIRRGTADLAGARLALYLTVWDEETAAFLEAPLGVFFVTDAVGQKPGCALRLTAMDALGLRFDGSFSDPLSYPATLGQIAAAIALQAGADAPTPFPGSDFSIPAAPRWQGASLRRALGYVCAAAGCFAHMNRQGRLTLSPVRDPDAAHPFSIGPDDTLSRVYSDLRLGPVRGLSVFLHQPPRDAEDDVLLAADDTGIAPDEVLSIRRNPLFPYGGSHCENLARAAFLRLKGLCMARALVRWRGDPTVELGRALQLTDARGAVTLTCATRQTLCFDRGFIMQTDCTLRSPSALGAATVWSSGGLMDAGQLIGSLDGGLIANGSLGVAALGAHTITARYLAAGAITADTIEAGIITTDKLAAGAVTAEKIESKSITAEQLQTGLITADSGLIADSAIDTAQIADGSITDAKIVDLTANKITGGTIDAGKVNVKNLNADNITVGTINGQRIPVLGGDKIEDGAISGVKIVDGAVTTDKIEDSAVTAGKIVAGAVTAEKIAAEAVTANKILAGAVTAGKIAAGAVTADAIAAGAIETTHISAAAQEALVLEAVSSVSIGGRNLLKNSDFAQGRLVAWGACPTVQKTGSDDLTRNFVDLTYNAWSLYQDVMLKANTRYTLSMDARLGSGAGESPVTVKLDTSNIQLTTQNVTSGYFKTGKRVYVSFTYGAASQTERIYLRSVTVEGRSIQVANIKLEEGNRPTDWTPAPEDPASGVQTSSVAVSAEGVDIASTGHFRTNAGTGIQMTSGDGQASFIRFGGASADEATFIADKDGVQAQSGEFKSLKAAGNDVWSTGNLIVSNTKPSGHGILWIKPSATSTVNASKAAGGETLDGGVERKIYLDRQGSDALTGTSFTYKVTAEFEEIKERRSGVKLQCVLAGNSQTVTMTYTYPDSYWLVWQHRQITFEATSAVNIFGGTGNIAVTFKALTLTPDTVSGGSFRLMPGTTITASGTSDSASGTEMACTMTWIP